MEPSSQTNLTLADVASMISIIDAVSTRGAFKPNEYAAVGELYTKLNAFLEQAKAHLEQANKPEAQGDKNA